MKRALELTTGAGHTGGMAAPTDHAIAVPRIELQGIEPLIWRRVGVPASMSLKDVHGVIQAVMGWLDCHLWQFEANRRKYSLLIPDDLEWNERIMDAARIKLSSLVADGVTSMTYVYDMGDTGSSSRRSPLPLQERSTRSSSAVNDAARQRIAAVRLATTNFRPTLPASGNARPRWIGMAACMIRMTSTSSGSLRASEACNPGALDSLCTGAPTGTSSA